MKFIKLSCLLLLFYVGHLMAGYHKITYGFVERAVLVDKHLLLTAKMDTGAKSASLSAIDITSYNKNGVTYLHFTVPTKTKHVEFDAEYVGEVKIKVRAGERKAHPHRTAPLKRPIVLVRIQVGNIERMIPVNLTNRKRFNYPLLLGRDAIKAFNGIIDPSTKFTAKLDVKG